MTMKLPRKAEDAIEILMAIANTGIAAIDAAENGNQHPSGIYAMEKTAVLSADGKPAAGSTKLVGLAIPMSIVIGGIQALAPLEKAGALEDIRIRAEKEAFRKAN